MPDVAAESGSDVGSVTWRLAIPKNKDYYLWGRVQAPTLEDASFIVRVFQDMGSPLCLGVWTTGVHRQWAWAPVDLSEAGDSKMPTPLRLPAGEVRLQVFARQAGAKIDRLFITDKAGEGPTD
jgi:hypothetical protein